MIVNWVSLQNLGDERGKLIVVEAQKNIPFVIKRVYCLYGMSNQPRGLHAHKKLRQVMVCLSGYCKVLLDNGVEEQEVIMSTQSDGLLIDKMVWHEMLDFSEDCVLMVLASDYYAEADYIRNYKDFRRDVGLC